MSLNSRLPCGEVSLEASLYTLPFFKGKTSVLYVVLTWVYLLSHQTINWDSIYRRWRCQEHK